MSVGSNMIAHLGFYMTTNVSNELPQMEAQIRSHLKAQSRNQV